MVFSVGENVPFWKNPWFWAFVVGLVCITGIRPFLRHVPDPPPVLAQLPRFELVDAGGAPFGTDDLAGRVWVVHFFSTRCEPPCPELTRAMGRLQARYDDEGIEGIRFAGFSTDPAHDTPARLSEYASTHGVDPRRWTLVTGEPERIFRLLQGGFAAALESASPDPGPPGDLVDAARFVLVDGDGRIRGFYGTDAMGLDEIFHRSRHVLNEQK